MTQILIDDLKEISDKIRKKVENGELKSSIEISANSFSETAKEKIEKAGGKAIQI